MQSDTRIEALRMSYEDVPVKGDCVIYCDIPYRDTSKYAVSEGFDYEQFYAWCGRQTQLTVISEYTMPEDLFVCVDSIEKRSLLCATKSACVNKTEGLFVPRHQLALYKARMNLLF